MRERASNSSGSESNLFVGVIVLSTRGRGHRWLTCGSIQVMESANTRGQHIAFYFILFLWKTIIHNSLSEMKAHKKSKYKVKHKYKI